MKFDNRYSIFVSFNSRGQFGKCCLPGYMIQFVCLTDDMIRICTGQTSGTGEGLLGESFGDAKWFSVGFLVATSSAVIKSKTEEMMEGVVIIG